MIQKAFTRILILCENRAHLSRHILGEHGFAALVQQSGTRLLLDTGQGLCLAHNAQALKVNLAGLDHLVISHGHYDHTGGMDQIPRSEQVLPVHAHPDIFAGKWLTGDDPEPSYIGIPFSREFLETTLNARFVFHETFAEISPGIFVSGMVPRTGSFVPADDRLVIPSGEKFVPDPFRDDLSLLIETASGPVILTGCAHAGIVNIMNFFAKETGHTRFRAVIGGTHLGFSKDPLHLREAMDAFEHYDVQTIAVSHCTGNEAAAHLFHRFRDRFAFAGAGFYVDF